MNSSNFRLHSAKIKFFPPNLIIKIVPILSGLSIKPFFAMVDLFEVIEPDMIVE